MPTKTHERKMLRTDWAEIPINNELTAILLQLANARNRLLNWLEAIPDRATYDFNHPEVAKADSDILDAMTTIGNNLLGADMVAKLTLND